MKKVILLSVASIGLLILSGCSLEISKFLSFKSGKESPQTKPGSIWKSTDGGATFEPRIILEVPLVENVSEIDKEKNATKPLGIISADILAITFHPDDPNIIYAGTINDGIFKTMNGGETWKHIKFPPQKIYSFTVDRNDPDRRMFAAGVLYGIGKIFRTDDGGDNWKEAYSEPGIDTSVTALSQHNLDTNIIFAGTNGGTVVKSTDSGQTWKNIGQKIDGPVTEILFDATKRFSVYALSLKKKIHYSDDGGKKWIDWEEEKKKEIKTLTDREKELRKAKNPAEADKLKKYIDALKKRNMEEKVPSSIVSLTASPFISGVVYAGTQKGELYKSIDYGKYWKKINIIESAGAFPIRMVAISYANKNELSFVTGKAFYKSLNGGESWAVTQLDVDRPVSVITYNPKDSNIIYIGLSNGNK